MKKNKTYYGVNKFQVSSDDLSYLNKLSNELLKKNKLEAGTTKVQGSVRNCLIVRVSRQSEIYKYFEDAKNIINGGFNYHIDGIQDIQLIVYRKGHYYQWHTDIDNDLGSTRKISTTLMLNDNYEGGDMNFFHDGEEKKITLVKRDLLAFTSFMNHSVDMVTKGERRVIVAWYKGKPWR
tara:strand:+ start:1592 stop:2128 length:537 start_codon:yes stop_codon:yes gene_type:complete